MSFNIRTSTPVSLTEEDKVQELDKGKFTAFPSKTNQFTLFGDVYLFIAQKWT